MPGIGHHDQLGRGPCIGQREGIAHRADHVVAAVHDGARQVGDARHAVEQLVGREEGAVGEVVRLEPREVQLEDGVLRPQRLGRQRDEPQAGAFVVAPGARSGDVHGGVGVAQAALVGRKQVTALFDDLGYDAYDVGPLAEGWRYQRDTAAYAGLYATGDEWPGTPRQVTPELLKEKLDAAVRYADQ